MLPTPKIARDIDDVIFQLENIIKTAEQENDRLGYFAALYHKVTCKVKEDLDNGLFENGPRLAGLDVVFANRYLFAWSEWKKDKKSGLVSNSWKTAFQNAERSSCVVLQHLLLGMNAHINYDLGIAVTELAIAGNNFNDLRKDYNAINNVLASLTYGVINKLNMVSPFLSLLGFTGTSSNSMLVQFSLTNARDGAWLFAVDLFELRTDQAKYAELILKRDNEMSDLGQLLVKNKGVLNFGIWVIHLFEWKKASNIIRVLHTHKKLSYSEVSTKIAKK